MRTTMKYMMMCLMLCTSVASFAQRPQTLWVRYDNRFLPNKSYDLADYDSLEFRSSAMYLKRPDGQSKKTVTYGTAPCVYMFEDPGRILYQPASMSGDFTKNTNHWCFERSKESEHFACFWENGANIDVDYMLNVAEKTWDVYTKRLGFVVEGNSSTDTYKIIIRAYNTTDWVASGSGEDLKVGTFNISPSAIKARGGHTVAHEIGHTFQYLTNVDCGANNEHGFNYGLGDNGWGGNGFWEDCANWMGYKVYPERQFTDGEYFEEYIGNCHKNIMHETARYTNCFYQDYLCDRFGENYIGRLWRESIRPEDPIDAMKRLNKQTQDQFSAMMYDCFAHMCTWDIPSVKDYAKYRVGAHQYCLSPVDVNGEEWHQVSKERCPQNYGYNISRLKVPAAGIEIKVSFKGLTGESGYRSVNPSYAGWRWGFVWLTKDGETHYGDMQTAKEGSASMLVPEGCDGIWLVVMGAPTRWWHHAWDDDESNDEQWPYRVKIEGSRPFGSFKTYTAEDFPEDYVRHDTTVVINASLPYSESSYRSVRVQYDMDAISEALGLTTAQLKAVIANGSAKKGAVRFAGISKSGAINYSTTTSTSSSTCFGHWFTTAGAVCGYDGSAAIFAEMYPDSYGCYVGQYPGRLKAGQTYIIRQAVVYNETVTKVKKAIMEVHLNVY